MLNYSDIATMSKPGAGWTCFSGHARVDYTEHIRIATFSGANVLGIIARTGMEPAQGDSMMMLAENEVADSFVGARLDTGDPWRGVVLYQDGGYANTNSNTNTACDGEYHLFMVRWSDSTLDEAIDDTSTWDALSVTKTRLLRRACPCETDYEQ